MAKGDVAQNSPIAIEVEAGKSYFWCSCGRSSKQPFCDGSHKGSEFSPMKWDCEEDGKKYFCACKQTDGQPFCDGSHKALDESTNETKDPDDMFASIEEREDGPLVVKHLTAFVDADGNAIEAKPVMALCRCGKSANKPFCDGSHSDAGFSSERVDVTKRDKVYTYEGKDVTVHYNKLLCSHAGECGRMHKEIFDSSRRPWIEPDNGTVEASHDVVAACPSGALRISKQGSEPEQICSDEQSITIERHGPYQVKNVAIDNVRWAQGATNKKFVLCRCGLSGNKPFCDGTHYDEKWRDDASES